MSRFIQELIDMKNLTMLRLKVMILSKSVMAAFFLSTVIAAVIIGTFLESAADKSQIPIGVMDQDQSKMSKELVDNLQKDPSLSVTMGSKEELMELLNKGTVLSVFEIKKGFEKNVNRKRTAKLVKDYYLEGRESVSILSDLVLSRMIDDICLVHAKDQFHQLKEKYPIKSDQAFEDYLEQLKAENEALFSFDTEVVNIQTDDDVTEDVENDLIYKQVIVIIISTFIAFITLFSGNIIISDKQYQTSKRIYISLMSKTSRLLGDTCSMFIISVFFALTSGYFLIYKLGFESAGEITDFISILLLYTICINLIFLILCRIIKDPILFQLAGAFVICILGIMAVMDILRNFIPSDLVGFCARTPSGIYEKGFTDIIINGNAHEKIGQLGLVTILFMVFAFVVEIFKGEDIRNEE